MAAQTITKVTYEDNVTVIGAANLNAIQDAVNNHASLVDGLDSGKVDKVTGKGLSTNDYTATDMQKVHDLPEPAQVLTRRTTGTEVYTHTGTTQGGAPLTETPTAGAVPQYGTDGVLKAGVPVAANDVVRKAELDEVVDEMSDSTTGLNSKAPAIYETVSGAIASFADGADGMPVKKLVANIEPQQDLHGYDNPWPAGGGVNLIDSAKFSSPRTSYGLTSSFDGDWIVISGTYTNTSPSASFRVCQLSDETLPTNLMAFPDSASSSHISASALGKADSDKTLTLAVTEMVQNETYNLRFRVVGYEGDTAPTSWTPYSNICPISGWTGAEIERRGKNLIPNLKVQDTSTRVRLGESTVGNGFFLKAGTYKISFALVTAQTVGIYWRTYKDGIIGAVVTGDTVTIDEDCFIRVWLYASGGISADNVAWFQLELGSTATDYEPYTGSQISVNWETEAGTVYGGTLTINPDRTGTLVVDRDYVDLSTLNWNYWDREFFRVRINLYNTEIGKWNGDYRKIKSNCFKIANPETSRLTWEDWTFTNIKQNYYNFTVKTSLGVFTDANDYKAWLADIDGNGTHATIAIEKAEPVSIPLTATEISSILTTLYGTNNIWSDVGPVEVTAPKDTRLYVDNHITQAIANALNS